MSEKDKLFTIQVSPNSTVIGSVDNIQNIQTDQSHFYNPSINIQQRKSPLREILLSLKEETLIDEKLKGYIDRLNHYMVPSNNNQRDLKTKLEAADRTNEIEYAEELKSRFAAKIAKNNFSETAQNGYVHILAKIVFLYIQSITPLIQKDASNEEIDKKIIGILEELYSDTACTLLEQDLMELKGMLYFLTGNCHIEWSKRC